uniref:Uncharacterized protein n=1 Tax=Glossina brevipalpis TaxID=37001 RepID=A0A1A9WUY5_9MUSC
MKCINSSLSEASNSSKVSNKISELKTFHYSDNISELQQLDDVKLLSRSCEIIKYTSRKTQQLTRDFIKELPTALGLRQGLPPGPGLPQGSLLAYCTITIKTLLSNLLLSLFSSIKGHLSFSVIKIFSNIGLPFAIATAHFYHLRLLRHHVHITLKYYPLLYRHSYVVPYKSVLQHVASNDDDDDDDDYDDDDYDEVVDYEITELVHIWQQPDQDISYV